MGPSDPTVDDDVVSRVRALESLLLERRVLAPDAIDRVIQRYATSTGPVRDPRGSAGPSGALYERRRNLVVRPDGRRVNVARFRGQLFVCATGCCCGRTDDGFAPVPTARYHEEWERRRLRNRVHLTVGGCLGPCALANVVLLLFDGRALWFHSINSEAVVLDLYDYIEQLLEGAASVRLPASLGACQFTASVWQERPDGQPVDDHRPRRRIGELAAPAACLPTATGSPERATDAQPTGPPPDLAGAALPSRNGEVVFEAPWQSRVFAMAVALSEQGVYSWEEFRTGLLYEIAAAESRGVELPYYHAWLAAFERVTAARGIIDLLDLEEVAFQFEFGERADAP